MFVMRAARGNKHNAKKVKADGYTFDSIGEYERYLELKILLQAGAIPYLKVHPIYPVVINGINSGTSIELDFEYTENGKLVIAEDFKGYYTAESKRMHKIFRALRPDIEFRLTRKKKR